MNKIDHYAHVKMKVSLKKQDWMMMPYEAISAIKSDYA